MSHRLSLVPYMRIQETHYQDQKSENVKTSTRKGPSSYQLHDTIKLCEISINSDS